MVTKRKVSFPTYVCEKHGMDDEIDHIRWRHCKFCLVVTSILLQSISPEIAGKGKGRKTEAFRITQFSCCIISIIFCQFFSLAKWELSCFLMIIAATVIFWFLHKKISSSSPSPHASYLFGQRHLPSIVPCYLRESPSSIFFSFIR